MIKYTVRVLVTKQQWNKQKKRILVIAEMQKIHPFGKSVNISPWYLKIYRYLKVDDICIYIHMYTCIYTGDIYSAQYTWHKTNKSQGRYSRWSLPILQKHRKLSCNHGMWSSQRSHPRSEHTILITLVLGVLGRKPVYIQKSRNCTLTWKRVNKVVFHNSFMLFLRILS